MLNKLEKIKCRNFRQPVVHSWHSPKEKFAYNLVYIKRKTFECAITGYKWPTGTVCAFVGQHLSKSIFCVILELNVLAYINLIKVTIDHLRLRGIWKYFANCLLRQLLRTICTKSTGHFMQFGNDVTVSRRRKIPASCFQRVWKKWQGLFWIALLVALIRLLVFIRRSQWPLGQYFIQQHRATCWQLCKYFYFRHDASC